MKDTRAGFYCNPALFKRMSEAMFESPEALAKALSCLPHSAQSLFAYTPSKVTTSDTALSALALACADAEEWAVRQLCAVFDPNIETLDGSPPLHFATVRSDFSIAQALLDAGADIHARNVLDQTALDRAAALGHADRCSELIAAGANPLDQGRLLQKTALMQAVASRNLKTIKILAPLSNLDAVSHSGETALDRAIALDLTEAAQYLHALAVSRKEARQLDQDTPHAEAPHSKGVRI